MKKSSVDVEYIRITPENKRKLARIIRQKSETHFALSLFVPVSVLTVALIALIFIVTLL